jgi:hypothetical protein
MNSRLPGSAPQRFWLAGEQEDARVFYLLERSLLLLSVCAEGAKRSQASRWGERGGFPLGADSLAEPANRARARAIPC